MTSEEQIDYKARIKELNEQLGEELGNWNDLEVDPNTIFEQSVFNPMNIAVWLRCLTTFLVDKGVIEDEDEFIVFLKETMVKDLIMLREDVEPQIRAARLKAKGVEFPGAMVVPKSKITKIH